MTAREAIEQQDPKAAKPLAPDDMILYQLLKTQEIQPSKPTNPEREIAKPQTKPEENGNFFVGKLDEADLEKLRPKVERSSQSIDFRFGLKPANTADMDNVLKRLNAETVEKAAAIKRHINTTGRNAGEVLSEAISDPSKVSFVGEEHTIGSASRELLRSVLEKGPANAIFTPEIPSALKPLFDRYNASPKDTKFTLPDDLESLVGKKAAAFCRWNEEIIGAASTFEAAHKSGMKIIPVDDPATMDIIDVVPPEILKRLADKKGIDENDPRVPEIARDVNAEIQKFVRGGSRNPAREHTIADNLLNITKEFPDSPIIAQVGRTHAAEHSRQAIPAAKLLASNPEFLKKGKGVLSFGAYDFNGQVFDSSLAPFAKELDRPVCFPTAESKTKKNPIAQLPELAQAGGADNFGAYDYVILMNSTTATPKAANLPNLELSESFLKNKVTPEQKSAVEEHLTVSKQHWKEMADLLDRNGITSGDLQHLQAAIDKDGKDPAKMISDAASNPRSLTLIDARSPRFVTDFSADSQTNVSCKLLAKCVASLPPSSTLAVDIPVMFTPFIENFNKSPKDTKFSTVYGEPGYKKLLESEECRETMLASGVFSSEALQVYEAAHQRGIRIVPFGTDVRMDGAINLTRAIETANEEHAQAIRRIAAQNVNAPVVVWSNRLSQAQQIEQLLTSANQQTPIDRDVKKIGFVGYGYDTVKPMCEYLKKPVGLDLKSPALEDLANRSLASVPISPGSDYKDCIHILSRTLGKQYDQVIMLPAKKN